MTQSEIREAIEQLRKILPHIEGERDEHNFILYKLQVNALETALSVLTDLAEGRLVRPMGREEIDKILPQKNNLSHSEEFEDDSPEYNLMRGYNAAIDDCTQALLNTREDKCSKP